MYFKIRFESSELSEADASAVGLEYICYLRHFLLWKTSKWTLNVIMFPSLLKLYAL